MKNIILINNLYKPFNRGGAEKIVEIIYREFKKQGHPVKIITTKPYGKKVPEQNKDIYYLNSFYYHLNKIPGPARLVWHIADIFAFRKYRRIKKILAEEGGGLVITHNLKGIGFLTPGAIKKMKAEHFHVLHDIQLLHPGGLMMLNKEKIIDSLPAYLYQKINAFLFRKVDKIISPSNWLLSLHLEKGFFKNSEKKVIFNPVTESFLNKDKKDPSPEKKKFTFLYVGQIEEHKGILLLIDAFKKFERQHSLQAELKIIGDGSAIKKAGRKARGSNVVFTGKKDNKEIPKEMRKGDCLIIPSLCYENSPTVIYEAALAGVFILASDHGGIPEAVSFFGGDMFRADDPENLAEKMHKIYKEAPQPAKGAGKKLKELTPSEYIKKMGV
ncbi:MAG: glycosyltransferase [Patescibacteria group bacterium]